MLPPMSRFYPQPWPSDFPDIRDRFSRYGDLTVRRKSLKNSIDLFQIVRISRVAFLQGIRRGQHAVQIPLPVIDLRIVRAEYVAASREERPARFVADPV